MVKPPRVCLILEGSYPFITGGVSAWVQDIIGGLPEIEFALFTLSPVAGPFAMNCHPMSRNTRM